eukprot:GHVL01023804.1.p1 GENE.GHVL01023804.1~~GHVL01023804.1.p1  ORF type:complete len:509 (-),score=81.68 GHVL01023804.1:245-1567(-)
MSDNPVIDILNNELPPYMWSFVHVVRNENREGLIRSRMIGADLVKTNYLFFLDGHVRVFSRYWEFLLESLQENPRRLVVPSIINLNETNWSRIPSLGVKMMFKWDFSFDWFDDGTDDVPISSGGIVAMSKMWWDESGKYDPGMLEWGGENIEQSLRVWMCGGDIKVVRSAEIGHIFQRSPISSKQKKVSQNRPAINQRRGAYVWLDDYFQYYDEAVQTKVDMGDHMVQRLALRTKLKCRNFQWFADTFKTSFEINGLFLQNFSHLQHDNSMLCLSAITDADRPPDAPKIEPLLGLIPCDYSDKKQQWATVHDGRMIMNREVSKCMDRFHAPVGSSGRLPILFKCDYIAVSNGKNDNQLWELINDKLITFKTNDLHATDNLEIVRKKQEPNEDSLCLGTDAEPWTPREISKNIFESPRLLPKMFLCHDSTVFSWRRLWQLR